MKLLFKKKRYHSLLNLYYSQPGEIYVRLHELLARIFKMRGQANYYEIDSDDEYQPVDNSEIIDKIANQRQDSSQTLSNLK
jgi:hypothetical protein